MYCPQLHNVRIEELTALTEDPASEHFFPAPPNAAVTAQEFDELVRLSGERDDPCKLVNTKPCKEIKGAPCERLKEDLPMRFDCRRPISKFLNLAPPPIGAVLVNRFPGEQIIRTGRGMARAVESETPGLYHRHALNYLIGTRSWSPPRQALVWAALDVALASALQAAWYYKWINPRTRYRERPVEYARRIHREKELNVLFELEKAAKDKAKSCDSPFKADVQKPAKVSPHRCPAPPPCIGDRAAGPTHERFDQNRGVQRGGQ